MPKPKKKRGVADTNAKTFKAMEQHSNKLYRPIVNESGEVRELRLRLVAFEEEVRVQSGIGELISSKAPFEGAEYNMWTRRYEKRVQWTRDETIRRLQLTDPNEPKPAA